MSTTTSTAPVRSTRPTVPFWAQVLLGLVVGVVLGFVARQFSVGWLSELLTQVGAIFVGLLRVLVVPLVLTALIVSITKLRQVTNAARLAGQTLLWFAITAAISVAIGITLGLLTNPGLHAGITTDADGRMLPETPDDLLQRL